MNTKKHILDYGLINIILMILVCILCSIYFYSQLIHIEIPIHSDDAGMAVDFKNVIDLGAKMPLIRQLNIFVWYNHLLYLIFGCSELFLQMGFTISYFFCCFFSLYFSLSNENNKKINWEYVLLFIFMVALPGNFGKCSIHPLKFHTIPLLCFFIIMFTIQGNQHRKEKKYKWFDIFILIFIVVTAILAVDILFFVMAVGPFILYFGFKQIKNGIFKKYIKKIIIVLSIFLVGAKLGLDKYNYSGYGSQVLAGPEDIVYNLGMGIRGVLLMFNIPIIGENILQATTLIFLIRLILLNLAFCVVTRNCYYFICDKKKVGFIDIILSLSIYCSIFAYIFSGRQQDEISVRYITNIYYLLIIVLIRYLNEKKWTGNGIFVSTRQRKFYISFFWGACIVSLIQPLDFSRDENKTDKYSKLLVEEYGLEYGLGEFWSANVVAPLSGEKIHVQAVSLTNDNKAEPYLNVWEPFYMGNYVFNFFVDSTEENEEGYWFGKEKIGEAFGKPIKMLNSNNRNIYIYDYDIRFPKKYLDSNTFNIERNDKCNVRGSNIVLEKDGKVSFPRCRFYTGTYRVVLEGENLSDNILFDSNINEEYLNIDLVDKNERKLIYEVTTKGMMNEVTLNIMNKGEEAKIKKCEISVLRAAEIINLTDNVNGKTGTAMMLEGTYDICLLGENMKELGAVFEQDGRKLNATKVNVGNKRITYKIEVPKNGEVTVVTNDVQLLQCSYETPYDIRIEEETIQIFDCTNRIFSNTSQKNIQYSGIKLENGELTFGPYITLERGNYYINILGNNLNNSKIRFTGEGGLLSIEKEVYCISQQEEKAVYCLNLEAPISDFEIIVENSSNDIIQIKQYLVESISERTIYNIQNGLVCNNVESGICILDKNEYIYGPYISLPKGVYQIDIRGEGLNNAMVEATFNYGKKIDEFEIISQEEGVMRINMMISKDIDNFELIIRNNSDNRVKIEDYRIKNDSK